MHFCLCYVLLYGGRKISRFVAFFSTLHFCGAWCHHISLDWFVLVHSFDFTVTVCRVIFDCLLRVTTGLDALYRSRYMTWTQTHFAVAVTTRLLHFLHVHYVVCSVTFVVTAHCVVRSCDFIRICAGSIFCRWATRCGFTVHVPDEFHHVPSVTWAFIPARCYGELTILVRFTRSPFSRAPARFLHFALHLFHVQRTLPRTRSTFRCSLTASVLFLDLTADAFVYLLDFTRNSSLPHVRLLEHIFTTAACVTLLHSFIFTVSL